MIIGLTIIGTLLSCLIILLTLKLRKTNKATRTQSIPDNNPNLIKDMEKEQTQKTQPEKARSINAHKSNGEDALRIVDNVCTIIGTLSMIAGAVWAIIDWNFFPLLYGFATFISMYITASFAKAGATIVKAAQLYIDRHSTPSTLTEQIK